VLRSGRWHLTEVQRLVVVGALCVVFFLTAMSWGMRSPLLLLLTLVLIAGAGVAVFLLGLRPNGLAGAQGEAYVILAPPPPYGQIVGKCDMQLQVELPGRPSTMVRLRDQSVPVTKWPRIGSVLPVEVDPRNPRQLRVRWELVEVQTSWAPTPAADAAAFAGPFYTEYAEGAPESESEAPPSQSGTANDPPLPAEAEALDENFPPAPGPEADPESARHAAVQAAVDHSSAEESARAADYELPVRGSSQPRPTDAPVGRHHREASPAKAGRLTSDDRQARPMGIMLVVSNLARSVRFYRDLLGFEVVDSGANIAVLDHEGGRVLLRQLADMSPVDRRVSHLHIRVADVEAAYKDLKTKGVEFAHRPRVITRGEKLDLWAATFRDPDGHDIALTQWREREE
jgi:catechol 2,3-dioxygenase-like lactoylglutathione lyase family enzyme